MKTSAIAAFLVLAGAVSPALATQSISCITDDGIGGVELAVGSLPVAGIANAAIYYALDEWSMADGDIVVGQQFAEGDLFIADFTDPNIERVMARLRLFSASENDIFAMAGTLQMEGIGAFALICDALQG